MSIEREAKNFTVRAHNGLLEIEQVVAYRGGSHKVFIHPDQLDLLINWLREVVPAARTQGALIPDRPDAEIAAWAKDALNPRPTA